MMMPKALAAILCSIACAFAASDLHAQELLTPMAGPSSPSHPGRGVVRSQRVNADKGVLAQLRAQLRDKPGQAPTVALRFFDDATFVARIDRVESPGLGATSYHGRVNGRTDGHVVIVELNGIININVQAGGRSYELRYFGAEGSFAREVNQRGIQDHPPTPTGSANVIPVPATKAARPGEAAVQADTGNTIDVMVLYTQAASLAQGGNEAMDALAATTVATVNTIYSNSIVTQRINLVYSGPVTHSEIDMDVDLESLTDKTDGVLDEVQILRDAYGADFVSLWGVYGDYCGQHNDPMDPESSGYEALAFNIVAYDCASGRTYAHELGHSMGLKHDNYQNDLDGISDSTTITPQGSISSTSVLYGHGYVDAANRFYTVMATDRECTDPPNEFSDCNPIPYFSNPTLTQGAAPLGNATTANESRFLNDTLETTRNFRQHVVQGAGKIVFVPKTYSVSEAGGSVQLTVQRLAGSTGAISVNYATVSGSASAGSDFVATSGPLSWADGDTTSRTITVPVLTDGINEGPESFTVALSGATGGATVGSNGGTATITILDDELDGFPASCESLPAGFLTTAGSNTAWTAATDFFYGSPCSLRSAEAISLVLNQFVNSDLTYTATFSAGTISFNYRVSSATDKGYFKFFIDGTEMKSDTGESGWVSYSTNLAFGGQHTLRWRFTNSLNIPCRFFTSPTPPGGENCADRAWIDNLIMPTNALVSLVSVASRSTHPGIGSFDRPIDNAQAIDGNVSTEDRSGASGHTIVFTFSAGIASAGTVTCRDVNDNPIGSCSVVRQGTSAIVTMSGVGDNQRVKVTVSNVNGNASNIFSASVGFLKGDIDSSRSVTASDILAAKGRFQLAESVGFSNFSSDIDLSGTFTQGDVDQVKANAGVTLN